MSNKLSDKGFALISPFEGFRHGAIEVFDEGQNYVLQVFDGQEVSMLDPFEDHNTQPDFDMVHPGRVLGCVENDFVGWIVQEFSARVF